MRNLIFILSILLAFSCNSYNKMLKSADPEVKLEAAYKYYEEGNYYKAMQLFENVIVSYRGTANAEKILFYYATSFYKTGEYLTAAHHFSSLVKNLPNSQYAEESMYMSAYCKYLFAPEYYLDQSNTINAIKEMQLFINKYPKSEKLVEANRIIDELRGKLEKKTFESAKQFFKMKEYKAAIVTFQNLIKDYPGTSFTEEASFMIIKSWFLYAEGSLDSKKIERYEKVKESFIEFSFDFPESKFLKESKDFNATAIKNIERMKSNISQNQ